MGHQFKTGNTMYGGNPWQSRKSTTDIKSPTLDTLESVRKRLEGLTAPTTKKTSDKRAALKAKSKKITWFCCFQGGEKSIDGATQPLTADGPKY